MADVAILRDLAPEGGLPWESEEARTVDVIRYGHQDRWEKLGDKCREAGRRVVDGACPGGALVHDASTLVPRASVLQLGN